MSQFFIATMQAPRAGSPRNGEKGADMTTTTKDADFERNWKNIASSFLKVGVTYGQMWGVMQAELQEKQQWVSKERFVEGLSLVNMLPGASAAQLSMFLGYASSEGGFMHIHAHARHGVVSHVLNPAVR